MDQDSRLGRVVVSSVDAEATGDDYVVTVVHAARAFRPLRDEWTALLLASSRPSVFLTWEWMTTWVEAQHGRGAPYILLAREAADGTLIGLAPLYRLPVAGPVGLRVIQFMGTGVGADHLAFICRNGLEARVYGALTRPLITAPGWDVLELPRLDGAFAAAFAQEVARGSGASHAYAQTTADACPYIVLPRTWEDYLGTIGRHRRSELRRQWRRLEQQGPVTIRRVETPADLADAWEVLLRLHLGRRQSLGAGSAFATPATLGFHQRLASVALDRGWLRFYLMSIAGRPVAAEYGFNVGGRVTAFQGGFDVDWARYGVGTLLTAHAIREAIAEGAVEYDFLRGAERYKEQRWAAQVREDVSLVVWKRHRRTELLLALRRWGRRLRSRLGRGGERRAEPAVAEPSSSPEPVGGV